MKKDRLFARKNGAALARALIYTSLCLYASAANLFAQEWRTVADGVEHVHVRRDFSGKTVDINLLRLDLKKVRLDVHHALDKAIGLEATSSIAKRKGAIAAINGGFFRLDKSEWVGDAVGGLLIDGRLLSENVNTRTALRINNAHRTSLIDFKRLDMASWFGINKSKFSGRISGVNREWSDGQTIAYTSEFGPSTKTRADAVEIAFSDCASVPSPAGVEIRCKSAVVSPYGNLQIPKEGFVVSMSLREFTSSEGELDNLLNAHGRNGHYFFLRPDISEENGRLGNMRDVDIIAGLPQLIKNGKIDITWEQEKASKAFVETRHPRTAVGKLKDGKFLMLTADGRSEASAGLDLYDLAKYMLELGATDAMNLDGGGSTTMVLESKVVNKPSDKEGERKIGDAIVVTLRKPKKRS